MRRVITVLSVGLAFAVGAAACGSSDRSEFGSNGNNGDDGGAGGDGSDPALGNGGGDFNNGGNGGSGGTGGGTGPTTTCNANHAAANPTPVNLIFLFDRSGSMKFNPQPNNKWDSVVQGVDAFFADTGSTGMGASMQVFPQNSQCSGSSYSTPIVALTPLPNPTFAKQLADPNNGPDKNFQTPTRSALQGTITYAQSVAKAHPEAKTAIVLATDGDPCGCNGVDCNDSGQQAAEAQAVASVAASVAAQIPTYVIGVGPDAVNLNAIASGGGTTKAITIDTSDPTKISADFLAALQAIRGETLSCTYAIPPAPAGKSYDLNSVNVVYTAPGTPALTLPYDATCAKGGWHYDNLTAPTQILLCGATCDQIKAGKAGSVDIEFGCQTQGGIPGYDGGGVIK